MKNNTFLKKVTFFCTGLGFAFLAGAQNDSHNPAMEVAIKKIIITNGDTLIEETTLTGDEAAAYTHDHMSITELTDIPENGQKRLVIINETIEEEIETDDKNQQNVHKVIVREVGANQDGASSIVIEDDEILIENENGELQRIELNSSSEGKRKVIVLKEEIMEEKSTEKNTSSGFAKNGNMSVYPNPNDGSFTIEVELNEKETARITVSDVNGRTLFSENMSGTGLQKKQINLDHYGKGIFFINVEQDGEVLSRKVIVD